MQIVQAPYPVLSQKAKPIKVINREILELIKEMEKTLDAAKDPEGIGLAAPQVGQSLQLFIIKPSKKSSTGVYINPQITLLDAIRPQPTKETQEKKEGMKLEGCLSLKDIWGPVNRAKKVKIMYLDQHGQQHEQIISGFTATIIQHEYDHLNGILFPRRVLEQKGQLYKSYRNADGEDEFEEINI